MHITGMDYQEYTDYTPMAWAVFYSASGGDNYIFGEEIICSNALNHEEFIDVIKSIMK